MKIVIITITITLIMFSSCWAADKPCDKLGRGALSIVTSPIEIVKQTRWAWIQGSARTYHISAWLFYGFVKGLTMTVERAGSGIWDILSFPFPVPSHYQPLLKPNTVFQDWPHRQPGVVYKQLGQK